VVRGHTLYKAAREALALTVAGPDAAHISSGLTTRRDRAWLHRCAHRRVRMMNPQGSGLC
jgi:hypothetical protein